MEPHNSRTFEDRESGSIELNENVDESDDDDEDLSDESVSRALPKIF